jgi:fatty-acyl-CoA synthase
MWSPCTTLVEAIQAAGQESSAQKGYIFLNGSEADHLPFDTLLVRSKAYAGALQQRDIQKGDRILLALPTNAEFASVYLGALLAGAVPCVLPSCEGARNQAEAIRHIVQVGDQLSASLLVATAETAELIAANGAPFRVSTLADLAAATARLWQPVPVTGEDLALIQASSGTTGRPKCVMLSHANIVANMRQIGERLLVGDDVTVCWLPLFHDMGLIGCFLLVLYWQLQGVFMAPYRFLRRPITWLKAISDYGGTLSPAPNFAYALAAQRVSERELEGLNLSTWRAALCGSEQIDIGTLQSFTDRFAPCGFLPESLVPCYGLAEASLCVTMHRPGDPMRYERVSRLQLTHDCIAVADLAADAADVVLVADCGMPVAGTQLRIVDEGHRELPEGHVGDVWIQGSSVTRGYYDLPDETRSALQEGWLNTGDLGYLRGGHLFITGRRKDLIVIRGHNFQPADFEQAAAEIAGITPGRVVAFGIYQPQEATEQLFLICERSSDVEDAQLCETIRVHVALRTGIVPVHVALVERNAIPRTTSGKLQRARAKQIYCETNFRKVA